MLTEEDSLTSCQNLLAILLTFPGSHLWEEYGAIFLTALTALTSHIERLVWFSNLGTAYLLRVHSTLPQLPLLPSKRTLQKHLLLHCICFTSHLFSISSFVIIPNILPFLSKLLLIDWLVLHNTKGLLTLFKK